MINSNKPSPILRQALPPRLDDTDLKAKIKDQEEYESQLKKWQKRMRAVQQAYFHQGGRAIIVFEGWDAAGKGGSIRRLTEGLDPRSFQVYPIAAPTKAEQGKHYLYRFANKLPAPGSLAIFDRSYYGRVLVERVEGFARDDEWQRAYQEINEFERMMMDDGVRVIKIFLHISKKEQLKRFEERLNNPFKRWKLTEEDIRNRAKWDEYAHAINEMFSRTSTENAPWHINPGVNKWYARIFTLKVVVEALERGVDTTPPPIDPAIVKAAKKKLGIKLNNK